MHRQGRTSLRQAVRVLKRTGTARRVLPVLESLERRALLAVDPVLDPTFGDHGGAAQFGFPGVAVAMLPDGKFAVATGAKGLQVIRVGADGTVDLTFGTRGVAAGDALAEPGAQSLAVQPDGKVLVASDGFASGRHELVVARYNADGTRDASFDGDGILVAAIPAYFHSMALAVRPDGKIAVAGKVFGFQDSVVWAHVLLSQAGAVEAVTQLPPHSKIQFPEAMAALPGGLVVIGGETANPGDFMLGWVGGDGRQAVTWEGGVVRSRRYRFPPSRPRPRPPTPAPPPPPSPRPRAQTSIPWAWMSALAVQPDGKVLAAGNAWDGSPFDRPHFVVARFNADGTRDRTFARDGLLVLGARRAGSYAHDVDVQPDGQILVSASFGTPLRRNRPSTGSLVVLRLRPDGSPDGTFGRRGRAVLDARINSFSELIIRPDGKYVVFGSTGDSSAPRLAAARYVIPAAGPA